MPCKKKCVPMLACLFLIFFSATAFPRQNHAVKVGLNYDISTVNMLEAKLGVDLPVLLAIHESLMGADPKTGERIPILAESFQVMENQKDIKVTLRTDARFHTGDPVRSQDVKFTYEQCVDPGNANLMAGPLDEIEEIGIPDELSRMAMLETGELDLISDVLPHQAKRLKRVKHVKVKSTSRVPSLYGIGYRCLTYPSMKDKKLKRAINHAINRLKKIHDVMIDNHCMY